MNIESYKIQLQDTVTGPMREYLGEEEDCGFSKKDVEKLESLVIEYLTALNELKEPSDKKIMKHVKTLVLSLNKLNKKTAYCLLETEEREAICEIIQSSAVECGLSDTEDDITEEWRDW